MSDHEEDESLLELHADSYLMLSSNEKLSSYRKKRLLCLQKKGKTTKHTPHKVRRNKFKLYRNDEGLHHFSYHVLLSILIKVLSYLQIV